MMRDVTQLRDKSFQFYDGAKPFDPKDVNGFAILIVVIGALAAVMCFYAGSCLADEAEAIKALRRMSLGSAADLQHQSMAEFGIAYAWIARGLGLGILSTTIGLAAIIAGKSKSE